MKSRVAGAVCGWVVLCAPAFSQDPPQGLSQGKASKAPDYQSGDWHLAEGRGKRVVAELTGQVRAPGVSAREWILYAARAPDHEISMVRRQFMWCETPGARRAAKAVHEAGGQEVFQARGATLPAESKQVSFRVRYEVTTSSLVLKPGKARGRLYLPRKSEVNRYLSSNDTYRLRDPDFKAWLKSSGLIRKSGERDLAFGWRVLQAIGRGFDYAYPPKSLERACNQVVADKASDCGGLSALAVSVLRANNVPARTLVGRWVEANKDSEDQYHVKFEFFAAGIGWVPCDGSGAVTWKGGPAAAFGKERGNFLVLHYDFSALRVDSVHWGRKHVRILQGVVWWVAGSGKTKGSSLTTQWTVRGAK